MTTMATPKSMRKTSVSRKAWRLLRLAVLWARKGSAAHSLRLLKTLRHGARKDQLRYGEREFSIDETPAFRFRTPSARVLRFIPCIAPAFPETPCVYGEDRYFFCDEARERDDDEGCAGDYYEDGEASECGVEDEQLLECAMMEASCGDAAEGAEDAGVDVKADEFIAKFHAQMKLQRQISWLQYNEMMHRSVC
ncbi:hypothetical protein QYE76_068549 [Lolium multiflorum]|uniref:Uncharacterized protein n=1 Tax=Lolium multiflorum TaxID=4521 RepID=A0AAD8SF12_LOLMU|nr:hypothetical protein QYE76_068549 [Lolium multiflorum]